MLETISGKIINYLYKSKDNDYKIAKIRLKDENNYETIVGYFPLLSSDINYLFSGEYVSHSKYGKQFKVVSFEKDFSQSKDGLISYLSSDLFIGIGPKTAIKIYEALGMDCIEKILEDKNVLDELGFNNLKKERFFQQLKENQVLEKTLIKLYSYGLTSKMAMKLFNLYGQWTITHIEENPYYLIEEVDNFGFLKADELALNMGIKENDIRRIDAGIFYFFQNYCYQNGNTYILLDILISNIKSNLRRVDDIDETILNLRIDELINQGKIVKNNEKYYINYFYQAEKNIASKVMELINFSEKNDNEDLYNDKLIKKAILYAQDKTGITYSPLQVTAIKEALNNSFSIITGGPGTGKTTVINGFLHAYAFLNNIDLSNFNNKISLVAPTGRAAKRITETTNFPAKTIHRLLGYGYDGLFGYNKDNLLPCDLLIVDESSMIDIFLAEQLLDAVKLGTKLIFVGDEDQLPSVSPGQVLKDLIESNMVKVIRLVEIHRQALDSNIIKLSYAIKNGELKTEIFNYSDDLSFIKVDNTNVVSTLRKLVEELVEKGYAINDDIQILAPMYKGNSGIDIINEEIEKKFINSDLFISRNEQTFKLGDKVLQLVNNPEKNIMNGDIGIVSDIVKNGNKDYLFVKFDEQRVRYDKDDLDELTLAYCISIHKSQGSEYPIVILPIVRSYSIMLRKKLIYTAVTRAKKHLIIVGDLYALQYGINNFDEIRKTSLKEFLNSDLEMENISPYDFMK